MKIRTGFVSNSSSSSFTCEICGATESGWDASPDEIGFVECEHGHLFCDEERLNPSEEDLDKGLINFIKKHSERDVKRIESKQEGKLSSWDEKSLEISKRYLKEIDEGKVPDFEIRDYDCNVTEMECPICNFMEPSFHDLTSFFTATTNITKDEVFAEIKKINKRRRVLRNHEYVEFCLRKLNTTTDELLMKIKNDFKTYGHFKAHIRSLK